MLRYSWYGQCIYNSDKENQRPYTGGRMGTPSIGVCGVRFVRWLCVVIVCVVIVIFASLPLEALIKLKWDQITSGAILDCY